ncbi:O-antigen ligase family protein [Candidatus Falkowbacteria bacterium]|nr:O-antigen ligase family protein [Candidatus Falkowbacteria bacterium]
MATLAITQNLSQSKLFLSKFGLFLGCLASFLLLSKLGSIALALSFVLAVFFFFIWRDELWRLVLLALPLITLGKVIFLEIKPGLSYEMTLTEAVLLFALVVFLIDRTVSNTWKEVIVDWITLALFGTLILAASSYQVGMSATSYIYVIKILSFSCLAYFLSRNLINSAKRVSAFYWSIAATILIIAGEIAYKFFQLGITQKFFTDRKSVVLPVAPIATTAAIMVSLTLLLTSYYLWRHQLTRKSFLWLGVIIIALAAIFLSLGKAALISLGIGMVFLFFKIRERRTALMLAGLAAAVTVALMFSPVAVVLWERVANTFNDANTQYRVLEYKTSWKILQQHWQFGVGAGQQMEHFKKMLGYDQSDLLNNFILQAAVDLGVLGVAMVTLLMASVLGQAVYTRRRSPGERWLGYGVIAMVMAAFVNGLVEVTFLALPYALVFWLSLGALINISAYEKSISSNN